MINLLFFFLFFINNAYAGEPMSAGEILEKDSYVFDMDEAKRLMIRMEDLEKKEKLYLHYQELDESGLKIIDLYKTNLELKDYQILEYKEIVLNDKERINYLEKREKWSKIERYCFFGLGMILTTGSFIIVDNISDNLD